MRSFWLLIGIGLPSLGWTYSLTLNEAIECALVNNARIQTSELDSQAANKHLETQKKLRHPTSSLHVYGDLEKNSQGLQATNTKRLGASPRLSYRSVLGTELHVQWNQAYHNTQNTPHERKGQWQLQLEQPLLKGARPNINRASIKDAYLQQQLITLQKQDTVSNVLLHVIQDYILLYNTWQSYELQKARFNNQKKMQALIEEKITLGRLSEVDGMAFSIQLAKLEQMLNQTNMQLIQQSQELSKAMGQELEIPQALVGLNLNQELVQDEVDYSSLALDTYLKPMQVHAKQLQQQETLIRDGFLWDLRIKGVMSQGKQAYHYDEAFDYDLTHHVHAQKHRYIGLFLTIPLTTDPSLDLSLYQNKSSQYKHQLEVEQTQLEVTQRVHKLKEQIKHWRKQQTIASKSYQLAQKTLKIEEHKYLAGRSSFYDLQLAQEMELQAAVNEQSTQASYFLAQVELDYIAGVLPERWASYEYTH